MNNPVAVFTKEEIAQTREAVLKILREKSATPTKPTEKKPAPIFFDVKTSVAKQKTNFKIAKIKTPINKNIKPPAVHRLVKHLEKKDSPLHQHYFLRSLKLLIFILTLAIIFLSGLLYAVFYFGAEGGS